MRITESVQIENRIAELNQEHQDLHYVIELLVQELQPDQLRIRRLKKRKLFVKDQLIHLHSDLIPDIDA
ncbi:MAG: hypothetical protein A6F71_04820 [Cycloclasticus sp. symbiont of Poecilosclerida sp. M]|nr:MAG: hypothetical protein A6F71_04820 [Cycloclasticus sp. symbiont of Poecilosclerida sp. M]